MLKKVDQSTKLSLGLRCSECLHYKRGPAVYEKKCSDLGIQTFAAACNDFTPDIYRLVTIQETAIEQIAIIARDLRPSQLRILSYLFKYAATIQKTGYKFGQPVYMNLSAPQMMYLDCWFNGRVIGASKDLKYLYIASSLRGKQKRKKLVFLSLPVEKVLSKIDFYRVASRLVKEGLTTTPDNLRKNSSPRKNVPVKKSKTVDLDTHEIPTIDASDHDLVTMNKPKQRGKVRSSDNTMKVKRRSSGTSVKIAF